MKIAIALYLIGLFGLHAISADFSNMPRSWKTRAGLICWPICLPIIGLLDLIDWWRGEGRPRWTGMF